MSNYNLFINRDVYEQYPNAHSIYTVDDGATFYVDYACGVRDIYVPNQGSDFWYNLYQECVPIQG